MVADIFNSCNPGVLITSLPDGRAPVAKDKFISVIASDVSAGRAVADVLIPAASSLIVVVDAGTKSIVPTTV